MVRMSHDTHCLSCGIATIRSTSRNKEPHSAASKPGEYAFLDIQQPLVTTGLTLATSHPYYLFVVDAFSRFSRLYGLANKSSKASKAVVNAIKQYPPMAFLRPILNTSTLNASGPMPVPNLLPRNFGSFVLTMAYNLASLPPKNRTKITWLSGVGRLCAAWLTLC
jgi:hypothetical protein